MHCEDEYLDETDAEHEPKLRHTIISEHHEETPKVKHCSLPTKLVTDTEAFQCLEKVIRWSMQTKIDALYLTMLRNLKCRACKGKRL